MKTRLLLLLLTLAPFLATAQFSSAQRQMNMTNNIVRQQNQMYLQIQRQQRDLVILSSMRASTENKLLSEVRKKEKLTKKLNKKETDLNIEKAKLANLKNSSSQEKYVAKAEAKVSKATEDVNKIQTKIETSNSNIDNFKKTIAESEEKIKIQKAEREEKKRLRKEKKDAKN
ncbi:chromosome segregation ATPase [Flavobacterium sp. 7E]|uniref:hypothetical protein n=1 Tax=Flavobacterium sp. 7E TaxID=2735898 RepID=UPI001571123C|nr:hypothetical protein [Flavobacterium sp. 7E]NRS87220.1 chromosome segregation ATPase [Flavobacterium sp. 7E]